jgi:aminoglycoside phosphotransferase
MSRAPGVPLSGPVSPTQLSALVEALRRLFAVPVPDSVPERAHGPSVMRGDLAAWLAEDTDLAPCRDVGLVAEAHAAARRWLAEDGHLVEAVTDRVAALGDGNLDNVLWDGSRCRLVDFEEFGVSDLAYELADVVEHVSSRVGRRLDVGALLARMCLDRAQRDRVDQYRRLMACLWLAMLLPGNRGFDRNPPGSTEDQAEHLLALLGGCS